MVVAVAVTVKQGWRCRREIGGGESVTMAPVVAVVMMMIVTPDSGGGKEEKQVDIQMNCCVHCNSWHTRDARVLCIQFGRERKGEEDLGCRSHRTRALNARCYCLYVDDVMH